MTTAGGSRLTEEHRLAQGQLGIEVAQQMLTAWRLLDPENLDDTTAGWLRIVVPLVQRQYAQSARLAGAYYRAFRQIEVGVTDYQPTVILSTEAERIITSLTVTGPVHVKSAMNSMTLARAVEVAQTTSTGSAQRLALDGGRSTIQANIVRDDVAIGFERITSGSACDFCTLLAARGAVFKSDTVAFAAHDGCNCSSQPVFESGGRGDASRVGEFVQREMTDAQRARANTAIRRWLADTSNP